VFSSVTMKTCRPEHPTTSGAAGLAGKDESERNERQVPKSDPHGYRASPPRSGRTASLRRSRPLTVTAL